MMTGQMTVADVISRRLRAVVQDRGDQSTSRDVLLRRRRDVRFLESAVNIIMQRAFVEGLTDAEGARIDPATTVVEAWHEADETMTIRMTAQGQRPVEMRYRPDGVLHVIDAQGGEAAVQEWRDLPDILPAFLTR